MFQEVFDRFGQSFDLLYYLGIIAAIPNLWKIEIRNVHLSEPIDVKPFWQQLGPSPSRNLYWKIVNKTNFTNSALITLWEKDLGQTVTEDEFETLYVKFCATIKPSKLRLMQYRVLTRSVTTNIVRNKWHKSWFVERMSAG